MDLNRLLELNDSYQKSHDTVISLIQGILDKGEVTGSEMTDMETSLGDCDEDYNQVIQAEKNFMKYDLQLQIDELKRTKLDINADSIIDLLTNGGRISALHTDGNGNIIMDVAKLKDLDQVKLVVDEQGKSIQGIIADTEVEQADGSKIKLKVAFSTMNQKVDSITTTVGQIEGVANSANDKAQGALTKVSQVEQTMDGVTTTVKAIEGKVDTANTNANSAVTKASQVSQKVDSITATVKEVEEKANNANTNASDSVTKVSQIKQTVDGITSTVGKIEEKTNTADKTANTALTKASQIEQTVDGIKQTVQGYSTDINKSVVSVNNKFYLSNSKESLIGGSWSTTAPTTVQTGKYLWIRPTYTLKDGTTKDGTAVCTSSAGPKGEKGDRGEQGAAGVGISLIITLYYVSTSKTTTPTIPGNGWISKIPTYQEGKYLWSAYEIAYTNGTIGYTTPQYCSEWEANHKAETAISIANQTSEKFEWIVQKGSTQSSITLTDKTIEAIANSNIKLKAKNISLEGIITANGSFRILEDGRAEIDSLSVDKEISTDVLTINTINNSRYQQVLDDDINITIYQSWPNSEEFEEGSNYQSFHEFADACPKNLNGYTVYIRMLSNLNENVDLTKFHSGIINIDLNNKTLFGNLNIYSPTLEVEFKENSNGIIMPNYGIEGDSGTYAIYANNTSLRLNDITVYAPKNGSGNKSGIEIVSFAKARIDNVTFVNCYNAVRAFTCSNVYVTNTKGLTSNYAFISSSNSVIGFGTATNCGGSGGKNTNTTTNGRIYATGAKFSTASVSGDNISSTGSTTTKTVTLTANYGDTYRKTVYNSWKRDGTVRQGDYGYGDCVGCWFFGNKLSEYTNKNISKITITFTRQSGGSYGDVTHGVKTHNYTSRPSGTPSFRSDFSKSLSVSVGSSGVVTLTSSTDIANFMKAKGVGLVPASQDKSHYSVCSGTCKIKITYTE